MTTRADADTGDDDDRKRRALWWLLGGLVVVAVLLIGGLVVLGGGDGEEEAEAIGVNEIFLQPAGEAGPDPFSPSIAIASQDEGLRDERDAGDGDDAVEVASVPGSRPGLYGGTENQSTCDREQLVDFLTAPENLAKAEAWAGVQDIPVNKIPEYIGGLTPLRLRFDTRVTNHGFRPNQATPYQAVLEAGTAVLVDKYGVPRARCACGNPLLEPTAQTNATFTGTPWDGFSPSKLKVMTSTQVLSEFIVTTIKADQTTGTKKFKKPVGTDGEEDAPLETATTTTSTTTTTAAPPTTTTAPTPPPTPAPAPPPTPPPAPPTTPAPQGIYCSPDQGITWDFYPSGVCPPGTEPPRA